jgi:hypothetical protein
MISRTNVCPLLGKADIVEGGRWKKNKPSEPRTDRTSASKLLAFVLTSTNGLKFPPWVYGARSQGKADAMPL